MASVVVAVERDVEVEGRGNLRVHLHEFCESSSNASRSAGGLPLLVLCVHGAGYSGRTFAPLAEALLGRLAASTADGGSTTTGTASEAADERPPVWIVAPDLRAHGATTADDEADLSIETLVKDLERLYETSLSGRFGDVVLVGWSLGAAIATQAAATGGLLGSRVVGVVAIDVVEGTAKDALKSMSMILAARPKGFDSIDEAVEWALSSGAVRRRASAENSVPGMLVERDGGRCGGGGDGDDGREQCQQPPPPPPPQQRMGPPPPIPRYPGGVRPNPLGTVGELGELGELGAEQRGMPAASTNDKNDKNAGARRYKYTWRVALERTEPFWKGWFMGLSQAFLDVAAPKMLLLAGHDRLDKQLTIAQMQGKFQMAVVQHAGHAIHEDQPEAVAEKIDAFLRRYKLLEGGRGVPFSAGCSIGPLYI